MLKSEELHALILSLSKSEKRYFKLFCTREASGQNYLKLFEAMEKQAVYDEQVIKERFKKEKFIRQLHVTKNYLRKLILKSLRNFHARLSGDAELKDILRNIEILYTKELFQHCETELKRAAAVAEKYELITGMVEIASWERKVEQAIRPYHYAAFSQALSKQKKAVDILKNNNEYWRLAVKTSSEAQKSPWKAVEANPLLESPRHALSLEAKVLYYNTTYLRRLQKGEGEQAGQALYELIELFERRPQWIAAAPGMYVSSINNLVSYLTFQKKHQEALLLIQKAKRRYEGWSVASENKILLKLIVRTYNIELELYRDTRAFTERSTFIESTEAFVQTHRYKMPKEYLVSFWFQLASIHFMRRDFNRSLHWINQLLNARFKKIGIHLQVQARMLNLMVHLEQQNLFVLRYYVDSARRYLKKVKDVQPFEKVLLRFFSKIGKLPLSEYKSAFRVLQQRLFPPNEPAMIPDETLGYIDYREWIDLKLKGS